MRAILFAGTMLAEAAGAMLADGAATTLSSRLCPAPCRPARSVPPQPQRLMRQPCQPMCACGPTLPVQQAGKRPIRFSQVSSLAKLHKPGMVEADRSRIRGEAAGRWCGPPPGLKNGRLDRAGSRQLSIAGDVMVQRDTLLGPTMDIGMLWTAALQLAPCAIRGGMTLAVRPNGGLQSHKPARLRQNQGRLALRSGLKPLQASAARHPCLACWTGG